MPTVTPASPFPWTPPPVATSLLGTVAKLDVSAPALNYVTMQVSATVTALDASNNRLEVRTVSAPFTKGQTILQLLTAIQAQVEATYSLAGTVLTP